MIKAKVLSYNIDKGFGIANIIDAQDKLFIFEENLVLKNKDIKGYLVENEIILLDNIRKDDKDKYITDKIFPEKDCFICERKDSNVNKIKRNNIDDYEKKDMNILVSTNINQYDKPLSSRDMILIPNLFLENQDMIYNKLLTELIEINSQNYSVNELWKPRLRDYHLIIEDDIDYKKKSPTFNMIIEKIKQYFKMDIKETRINFYKDTIDWKKFHHDTVMITKDKQYTSNFTVGVSFGYERELCFEHTKTKNRISFNLTNGLTYAFSRDVNIKWRHGILPIHPDNYQNQGRISIIAWGLVDLID